MELKTIILKKVTITPKYKILNVFSYLWVLFLDFLQCISHFEKSKVWKLVSGNGFQERNDRSQCYKWLKENNGT